MALPSGSRPDEDMSFPVSFTRICLVGSNPSHLIKSNVLRNDIRQFCRPDKWCSSDNITELCPLYASICLKSTNTLCSPDGYVEDVRIEQGVPGLKRWQLFGQCLACTFEDKRGPLME